MKLATVVLALALSCASASYASIAGYTPNTDVVQHSRIDLDQKNLMSALKPKDANDVELVDDLVYLADGSNHDADYTSALAAARLVYTAGGESMKSTGARTIKKFSTGLHAKAGPAGLVEDLYMIYNRYWNSFPPGGGAAAAADTDSKYGDLQIVDALADVPTIFAALKWSGRVQFAQKTAAYTNTWMYVTHELRDAVGDCRGGQIFDNDLTPSGNAPHAWDEAWAFYAGSLEVEEGGKDGKLVYNLAQKRCKDYATCIGCDSLGTTTCSGGTAKANADQLELYKTGQALLNNGRCDDLEKLVAQIEAKMSIPLIQGMLKYAYKQSNGASSVDTTAKSAGEGWAFASAILPRIHNCDAVTAASIRTNMDLNGVGVMAMGTTWPTFYAAVQAQYSCLGVTCADIGGYTGGASTGFYTGFAPCTDTAGGSISGAEPHVYKWCEAGTYKTVDASSVATCTACPAGTTSTEVGVGYGASISAASPCTPCPAGTSGAGGAAECNSCAAGTYTSHDGGPFCAQCENTVTDGTTEFEVLTGGTACVDTKDEKTKKAPLVSLPVIVVIAVLAILMIIFCFVAGSYKSNYDRLMEETSGGKRLGNKV